MIRVRKKRNSLFIMMFFIIGITFVIASFAYKVRAGVFVTPMSVSEINKKAGQYTFGKIYDRNNKLIASGTDSDSIKWDSPQTEYAFRQILGIEEKAFTQFTVCGNAPWLYGAEDDRLGLSDLLDPGKKREGGSIRLTIDKELQEYIGSLINANGYEKAYIMVSNYKTGEILAAYGDVMSGYVHPGSTIKPFVAAAALSVDSTVEDFTYKCSHNHTFVVGDIDIKINCSGGRNHGNVDLKKALTQSCNGYFVSLLQKLDIKLLMKEISRFGFDDIIRFHQFRFWDSKFAGKDVICEEEDLARYLYSGIGQGNCKVSPASLNFATNAILNEGIMEEPVWFTDKKSTQENEWEKVIIEPKMRKICCSKDIAAKVKKMMVTVTQYGTGVSFYLKDFAAKTGTAQKDDSELLTVITTGGLVDDKKPYSVTVILDDVPSDMKGADAGKIAQEILLYLRED